MPKAKKASLSTRSTPYGVMSSEESSEDRLAQFLTSDRSRRRSAVVDLTDSFSTSVSLPLNMKCLSTSDGESSTDTPPIQSTTETESSSVLQEGSISHIAEKLSSGTIVGESKVGASSPAAPNASESHNIKCAAESCVNDIKTASSLPKDAKDISGGDDVSTAAT